MGDYAQCNHKVLTRETQETPESVAGDVMTEADVEWSGVRGGF